MLVASWIFADPGASQRTSTRIGKKPRGNTCRRPARISTYESTETSPDIISRPIWSDLGWSPKVNPSKFRSIPNVHPCIYFYNEQESADRRSFYQVIRSKVEARKAEECVTHNIAGTLWDGYRRGLNLALDEAADLRQFEVISSRAAGSALQTITYGRKAESGLFFYFHADNGVRDPLVPLHSDPDGLMS
jgi:hypothetical protein